MSNQKAKAKPIFRAVSVHKRDGKEVFAEIGAAWESTKGGFNIRLNTHPIGDTILLRPFKEKDEAKDEAETPAPEADDVLI